MTDDLQAVAAEIGKKLQGQAYDFRIVDINDFRGIPTIKGDVSKKDKEPER